MLAKGEHQLLPTSFSIKTFTGPEAREHFRDLAHFRISLFKEFPYLYQGTEDYEKEYLETYFRSPNSHIILVYDRNKLIACSTGIPLTEEMKEIQEPFLKNNISPSAYFYIGEVLILPEYRGKGILRKFFEAHESYAHKKGLSRMVFMTVDRPNDHPHKPQNYRELKPIWNHFSYEKMQDGMKVNLSWNQIDSNDREVHNTLSLWEKIL